jgi:hypothetical protein
MDSDALSVHSRIDFIHIFSCLYLFDFHPSIRIHMYVPLDDFSSANIRHLRCLIENKQLMKFISLLSPVQFHLSLPDDIDFNVFSYTGQSKLRCFSPCSSSLSTSLNPIMSKHALISERSSDASRSLCSNMTVEFTHSHQSHWYLSGVSHHLCSSCELVLNNETFTGDWSTDC